MPSPYRPILQQAPYLVTLHNSLQTKHFQDNSKNHNFFLKIEILELVKIETNRTKIQNGFFAREGHLSA